MHRYFADSSSPLVEVSPLLLNPLFAPLSQVVVFDLGLVVPILLLVTLPVLGHSLSVFLFFQIKGDVLFSFGYRLQAEKRV